MNRILLGAVAGLAATLPMTIFMKAAHSALPRAERYVLPPREIVDALAQRAEISDQLTETQKTNLTIASHFAYGAACGAIYPFLTAAPNAPNGMLFGIGVWTASYLGWLPALDILGSATEHPQRRVALMIGAHLVWGAVLGASAQRLNQT